LVEARVEEVEEVAVAVVEVSDPGSAACLR
jgi:hypothetical protein